MAGLLANLRNTVIVSLILAIIIIAGYEVHNGAVDAIFWQAVFRFVHVLCGIMWIGLLYYFNFVQIPTMPNIPAELKPGVSKYIAPNALFYFRWGAAFTVLTGLILAWLYDELIPALTLQESARLIGIGMWLALIMAANVWMIIWPNQQRALGLVAADDAAKAKSARTAMLASRINTLLSIPMLLCMTNYR